MGGGATEGTRGVSLRTLLSASRSRSGPRRESGARTGGAEGTRAR